MLGEALEAARAIEDEGHRSAALAALAPHLTEPACSARRWRRRGPSGTRGPGPRRWPRWPPTWRRPSGTRPGARRWRRRGRSGTRRSRSQALAALAPRLAELGQPGRGAGGGAGDRGRAGPVPGAGRAGPPPGADRAGPGPARGAGGGAGDRGRVAPVPGAGGAGPPPDRAGLLGEALEAARAIGDEGYRSAALAALAPHLAPTARDQPCARRWRRRGRSGTSGTGPRRWPRWPPT